MARRLLYLIDMDRIDTNHHLHLRWFIDYYISVDQLLYSYGVFSTPFSLLVRHSHYQYVLYAVCPVRMSLLPT